MVGTPTFAELEALLPKIGAKLEARQVHALYLGALTSTSFGLGPQQLLELILGEAPTVGASIDDANAVLQVLFGYWNTLITARKAEGGARLAPTHLPAKAAREELERFARQREDEIDWYVKGLNAGDGPIELGDEGLVLFERLAEGASYLDNYGKLLAREGQSEPKELAESRASLLQLVRTIEAIIDELMTISDAVRREAMDTFAGNAGATTNDGVRIGGVARPPGPKVGRNDACPCGSGKKWKKCCGSPAKLQ